MLASELISQELFPLKKTDTADVALMLMHDQGVYQLPVVDSGKILGYCDYNQLSTLSKKTLIADHIRQDHAYIVRAKQHLFEVMKVFAEQKISVLAVINEDTSFAGIISGRDLVRAYKNSALSQPGGILTLQMAARNYSLAEISRLVEFNDTKILHVMIQSLPGENDQIEVSLKFNTAELKNVISTLERYQYAITGVYQAAEIPDNFQSRFDYLLKYLNT